MIGIVDYGSGNVRAFANVYRTLGIHATGVRTRDELAQASKIIIPGVGAFDHVMGRLAESGMRGMLDELVLDHRVPVLGVCVGMQMFMSASEEGDAEGLNWIPGEVKRFEPRAAPALAVPHMGWNDVRPIMAGGLFESLEQGARFYFLHSYVVTPSDPSDVLAVTDYGGEFVCAVRRANIFGVQFHPEKSHASGIRLLKNFAELV